MTNDELQAIKARCEAATPGPWFSRANRDFGAYPIVVADRFALICSLSNGTKSPEDCNADCDCIARARTDIPALLAHIAAQQAALEQAWYVLDSAAAGVAPKAAAVMARSHVEKFIGKRESNFDDAAEVEE